MSICNHIFVSGKGLILIGENFKYSSGNNINPISRNLKGSFVSLLSGSLIEIGDNVAISSACIWAKDHIKIGDNVNIGGNCLILDNDAHPLDYRKRNPEYINTVDWAYYQNEISCKPIIIEDNVWLGANCIILKGVTIGARSIIAAGSVVVKDIPSDVVAGGNPCQVIKSISVN